MSWRILFAPIWLAGAALVCGHPALAATLPPTLSVCATGLAALDDPTREALEDAFAIEARKAGVVVAVEAAPHLEKCIASARLALEDSALLRALLAVDHQHIEVATDGAATLSERASRLAAEGVLFWLAAERALPLASLTDGVLVAAQNPPTLNAPGWSVGLYAGPRVTLALPAGAPSGWAEVELMVAYWQERFGVGVFGGWMPKEIVRGANPSVRRRAGDLGIAVRGGPCFGAFCVRGAVGMGWQRRSIQIDSSFRIVGVSREQDLAFVFGEAEWLWKITGPLRMSVLAQARRYWGAEDLGWAGATIYNSPRAEIGGALRVGYVF